MSLETLKQQSPAQRWERVKTQTAPDAIKSSASKQPTANPGIILPLPEDDVASASSELKLAPALPDASEEPRWIVPARPVPTPIEEPEAAVKALPLEPKTVVLDESASPPLVARSVDPPPGVAQVQEQIEEPAAMKPMPGTRKLRTIQDISPYYDTAVDKDIREFAQQRAGDYGVAFGTETFHPRDFPDTMYAWEPSNFYNYPLYFEDAVLERYGHTYPPLIQPVVSVAKFGTQLVLLPYQMTLDPVNRPMYALGWYRPGDCAPKLRYQPPLNGKAAAVEAGVVTGLFFLIP